jgi:tRNA pseudouridine38-40 synthase
MTRNFKLTLCYDGTRYDGWQRQGNTKNTIQEILEDALSGIFGAPTEAAGSGRTDEGVHALGQVVSFRADSELSADDIYVNFVRLCLRTSALWSWRRLRPVFTRG